MSIQTEEKNKEIEVYVCWEYELGRKRIKDPVLMKSLEACDEELIGFEFHPMCKEILALADLAGRDDALAERDDWKRGEDGRVRFSNNFFLPAEWFDGCEWEE